jgi:hypothetical protein
MKTAQLIRQAMHSADHLLEHGVKEVRLPLLLYKDWLEFYGREDGGESRERRRLEQKLDWYLTHFLRAKEAKVEIALISRQTLLEELGELGSSLDTDKEKRTALNKLSQMGKGVPAPCKHTFELNPVEEMLPKVGTVTLFGEPEDGPEIMSAVVHLKDGSTLAYENVLASEHSPQEAQAICLSFFDRYSVTEVFSSPGLHTPEFCEDCNELLVKVADPDEVAQVLGK